MSNSVSEIIENPEIVSEAKTKAVSAIKMWLFDILGLALVVAMFLLGLGAFGFVELTWQSLLDTLISFIPYYLSLQLLNMDYYTKGTFKGKESEVYQHSITAYSEITSGLTGEQHDTMNDFCEEFNRKALISLQTAILRRVSISYKLFAEGDETTLPLNQLDKKQLRAKYNREVTKVIYKAKRAKIHGVSASILLSNVVSQDATNIGKSEKQLMKQRMGTNAVLSFVSVFLICLIAVKDFQEWGWVAAAVVLFKMVYVFIAAYMKYFTAYQDITVDVVNYLARKTDILKQFIYWYKQHNIVESLPTVIPIEAEVVNEIYETTTSTGEKE